jgi:hypothetical protein
MLSHFQNKFLTNNLFRKSTKLLYAFPKRNLLIINDYPETENKRSILFYKILILLIFE